MALKKATKNGGAFFEPKNHTSDLILVIEGKKILKDQPCIDYTTKRPATRDVGIADIAVFRNSDDIANQEPSLILSDAQITASVLVGDLERNGWLDGDAGLAVIRRPGQAYVYRDDFSAEAEAAAVAWYEARNANRESATEDMPDF